MQALDREYVQLVAIECIDDVDDRFRVIGDEQPPCGNVIFVGKRRTAGQSRKGEDGNGP